MVLPKRFLQRLLLPEICTDRLQAITSRLNGSNHRAAVSIAFSDQATRFWPVYDQYTADLVQINNAKYDLIKEYAQNWGTMTDDQALSMLKRSLEVDAQVNQLRQKYVPIFNKVVPGKTTATFFQVDRRIQSMIDLQLGSQLPLVQDQE